MIESSMIKAARAWRALAGEKTALERYVKRRYQRAMRREAGQYADLYTNQHSVVIRAKIEPEKKVGIFLKGGCDLPTLFLIGPLIKKSLRSGSVAIVRPPDSVGSSQSAQMLQTMEGIPPEHFEETCRRLRIRRNFFEPVLFEDGFEVRNFPAVGRFPKTVIALSVGSDVTRSLYRHREYGFLVDIGGWWLNQSLDKAIKDVDTVRWFKDNFEAIGKIEVADFQANFERIIRHLHSTGSQVIVLNTLVVDPLSPLHNYQLHNQAHMTRRREFNIALNELSARLGFHVVDIDRLLKMQGVREQIDFAHISTAAKLPIAHEGYRILRELGVA
jgi:hypothetical protein